MNPKKTIGSDYYFGSSNDIAGLGREIRNNDPFISHYLKTGICNAVSMKFAASWKVLRSQKTKNNAPAKMGFPRFPNTIPSHVEATEFVVNKEDHKESIAKFQGQKFKVWLPNKEFDRKQKSVLDNPLHGFSLVRRRIRGHYSWYASIIVEGKPNFELIPIKEGVAGIDVGTRHIAISDSSGHDEINLFDNLISKKIKELERAKRIIGRARDRSLRQANPKAYDEKGCYIVGVKLVKTNNFWRLNRKQKEKERQLCQMRKHYQGKITSDILRRGNSIIKMEDVSTKSWQEEHGKAVGNFAPGRFMLELERKAKNLNVGIEWINTYKTKLSQTCVCGNHIGKAPLSVRIRTCEKCGRVFDRDIMSSFLIRFVIKTVDKNKKETYHLDIERALAEFQANPF